jgi:protein-L-isoaspartate(D-aspartate) O-methyltransferase
VVHIGAGTGYYTAILAELVGANGNVVGYEIETSLAEQARRNLRHLENVVVHTGSPSDGFLPRSDVIYVNAAATHPLPEWLDALNSGGRLIFPLSPDKAAGSMLQVTRIGDDKYSAKAVIGAAFTPCVGARNGAMSEALASAMKKQPMTVVRSLHRNDSPDASAWCVGQGWWLSTNEVA